MNEAEFQLKRCAQRAVIYIDSELLNALETEAHSEDKTRTALIVEILRGWVGAVTK